MNIISVINTNTVEDIPNALRDLADIVEKDITVMGYRANGIGMFGAPDTISGDFDYQIQQTSLRSILGFVTTVLKRMG